MKNCSINGVVKWIGKEKVILALNDRSEYEYSFWFMLFHEIGHIKTYKSSMRRCESEYYATVWAIEKFKEYDLIIGPSSSRVAYDLNNNMDDPLKCFMDDILVMHANMGGFPSLSLPVGLIDKLPIGMQIMAKHFNEATIYKLASFIEKEFKVEEVK